MSTIWRWKKRQIDTVVHQPNRAQQKQANNTPNQLQNGFYYHTESEQEREKEQKSNRLTYRKPSIERTQYRMNENKKDGDFYRISFVLAPDIIISFKKDGARIFISDETI